MKHGNHTEYFALVLIINEFL